MCLFLCLLFYLIFIFYILFIFFFFSSRRRHTRSLRDWSSDVCSSDLTHAILNLKMPKSCPGVDDASMLNPRNTWKDKAAYDQQATKLRDMFRQNFESKGFAKFGIEARI